MIESCRYGFIRTAHSSAVLLRLCTANHRTWPWSGGADKRPLIMTLPRVILPVGGHNLERSTLCLRHPHTHTLAPSTCRGPTTACIHSPALQLSPLGDQSHEHMPLPHTHKPAPTHYPYQGTNNYVKDVYNGDLGTVKSVNEKERFVEVRGGTGQHAQIHAKLFEVGCLFGEGHGSSCAQLNSACGFVLRASALCHTQI